MSNEIVKYRNRMNEIPLRKFDNQEMNIFLTIASRFLEKGTGKKVFSLSKLQKLSKFPERGERFITRLRKTNRKLLSLTAETDDGRFVDQFQPFNEFRIDRLKRNITISVNPKFKSLFNDLVSDFTRFALEQFTDLKSTYAKTMFRILKQYRTKGWVFMSLKHFRYMLAIPDSYQSCDINKRVFRPIKIELSSLFKNLRIQKFGQGKKVVVKGTNVKNIQISFEKEGQNKNDFSSAKYDFNFQIANIKNNKFLTAKEKKSAEEIVNKKFANRSKKAFPFNPNLKKRNIKKINNQKAQQALNDYKKNDK